MVPGVEIAIHSLDLTPDRMASDDAFTVRRSADEDSVPVSTGLEDEEKTARTVKPGDHGDRGQTFITVT
jgi:hypothetical protein